MATNSFVVFIVIIIDFMLKRLSKLFEYILIIKIRTGVSVILRVAIVMSQAAYRTPDRP